MLLHYKYLYIIFLELFSMAELMDCEAVAQKYFGQVKNVLEGCADFEKPRVVLFLATSDLGSESYARSMCKKFWQVGIATDVEKIDGPKRLEERIRATEFDDKITGCFVFYPIRFAGILDSYFMKLVPQYKDVEGLNAENIYRLIHYKKEFEGTPCKAVVPCTPKAVIKLLYEYGVEVQGKDIVIVNKSYAVGAPLRRMFDNLGGTVTCCDANTKQESIRYYTKNADIIVTAVPIEVELFDERHVKEGATVIDVSFTRNFDVEKVGRVAERISYCEGKHYVGRVTTAMAAVNTLYLWEYQRWVRNGGKK